METSSASFFSILAKPVLSSWTMSPFSADRAFSTSPFWTVPSGIRSVASRASAPTHWTALNPFLRMDTSSPAYLAGRP